MTYCSASGSITRRHPSSEMAATYLTSGENTKSPFRKASQFPTESSVLRKLTHRQHPADSPANGLQGSSLPYLSHPVRQLRDAMEEE